MNIPGRYSEPTGDPKLGPESAHDLDAITAHIESFWGPIDWVFHEAESIYVHLDLHVLKATAERPFHFLFTTGMSDRPMTVPEGAEDCGYAELMLALPPEWPLDMESFRDERHYWPLRQLKQTARYPHAYGTWLWYGHTCGSDRADQPLAPGLPFTGLLLAPPVLISPEAPDAPCALQIGPEKRIEFFSLIPLYPEEMRLARREGSEKLWPLLMEAGVSELIELGRPNVCA